MFSKTAKVSVLEKNAEERESVDPTSSKSRNRRRLLLVGGIVLGVALVGLGVGLGVGLTRRNSSDDSAPSSSSSTPIPMTCPYNLNQPDNYSTTPNSSNHWWKPAVNTTWQIVLNPDGSTPNLTYQYEVYDLDLFDNNATFFSGLHSRGKKVICYFSAGSYENWRDDASCFTPQDKGAGLDGWAGEQWLDTDSHNVRSIMLGRLDLAVSKGCDGVDPDNVDGYDNPGNGFNLTEAQAISYVSFLADAAHARNLSVGLKNAGEIAGSVIDKVDWEVNEECIARQNCGDYSLFIPAGKPVFNIEYPPESHINSDWTSAEETDRCEAAADPQNDAVGFSTILKQYELDEWIMTCH